MGLPVLQRSSPCRHAVANTPAELLGALFARFPKNRSLPRILGRVGFRITLFEACSAFTHITACLLAKSPKVTLYTRGFSRFVTSATAPIATGWSESCRAGFAPAERPCLCTAHEKSGLGPILRPVSESVNLWLVTSANRCEARQSKNHVLLCAPRNCREAIIAVPLRVDRAQSNSVQRIFACTG